ncbi:CheY-like superfamily [Chytridium lagenaria]|nr:CheY-like superfamily [Chytridium lagenaria]
MEMNEQPPSTPPMHLHEPGVISMTDLPNLPLSSLSHILIVDDDMLIAKILANTLRRIQPRCSIDIATNGEEAIRMCQKENYCIVFMDLSMPVLDGYSATRELRSRGLAVPIVAASSDTLKDSSPEDLGFNDYMRKPFNREMIENVLTRLRFELNA